MGINLIRLSYTVTLWIYGEIVYSFREREREGGGSDLEGDFDYSL
jgi:hypothetical protein